MTLYQVWRLYAVRVHVKVITHYEWTRISEVVIMAYVYLGTISGQGSMDSISLSRDFRRAIN
jgi:hypothetical protein